MTGVLVAVLLWLSCWLLHRSPPRHGAGTDWVRREIASGSVMGRTPGAGTARSGRSRSRTGTASDAPALRGEGIEDAALMMDLMASMLAAGASIDRGLTILARSASPPVAQALTAVVTALDLGAPWEVAWAGASRAGPGGSKAPSSEAVAGLGRALRFAGTTGAPSAAIMNAHAAQYRRRRNREAERRAAALGVKLVVPLGLCSLPAFVCLGVIPILVGLFPALK
ncbi:type II secretion system F family protein [Arthrobacter tecti]